MAQAVAQTNLFKMFSTRPQESVVAAGVIAILAVMVMPIPPFGLDILLSFSLTFSLIILLVSKIGRAHV